MHKLTAVEEAKRLFEEAKDWGVWRWLTEKRRARSTADRAWEALEEYENSLKADWPKELRKSFAAHHEFKQADAEAYKARMEAEAQFDEADRRLSTSMAREGSQMAIDAWKMRERFIRKIETWAKE